MSFLQPHAPPSQNDSPCVLDLPQTGASAMKTVLRKLINSVGLDVARVPKEGKLVRPLATHAPWTLDEDFLAAHRRVRANTVVDVYRCYELWTLLEQVANLEGDILEVGVYRGGTGALMAARAKQLALNARVYLCDTFSGMVKTGDKDSHYRGGEFADTSETLVKNLLQSMRLENASTVKGIFPDESANAVPSARIRLCHIDVDVYRSAEDVLAWAWPRMSPGAMVIYDDYGFPDCSGIIAHVDPQRKLDDRIVVHNLNGHAIVVKLR